MAAPASLCAVRRKGRPQSTPRDGNPRAVQPRTGERGADRSLRRTLFQRGSSPGNTELLRDNEQFNRISSGLDGELGDAIDLLEMQMQSTIELLEVMEKEGAKGESRRTRGSSMGRSFRTSRLMMPSKVLPETELTRASTPLPRPQYEDAEGEDPGVE